MARHLANKAEEDVASGRRGRMYEGAIRDLLMTEPANAFGVEDVTGLPWIEIDFPEDIVRANDEVLPLLQDSES